MGPLALGTCIDTDSVPRAPGAFLGDAIEDAAVRYLDNDAQKVIECAGKARPMTMKLC
jgi:hypothetical protein